MKGMKGSAFQGQGDLKAVSDIGRLYPLGGPKRPFRAKGIKPWLSLGYHSPLEGPWLTIHRVGVARIFMPKPRHALNGSFAK
jgi:hypothetical protein